VVYGALAVVIGAVALRWLLLPRCGFVASEGAPVARLAAKAGMAAAAVMLLAVPGRVALQLADFLEPGEAWRPALDAILFSTQSGKAAQLQMVWATAALLSFSVARSGRTRGWRAAGVTALVLALTPGLGGHPASSARPVLAMTFATMHVLALGMWIGTLFHLLRTARALSDRTLQVLLAAFHPVALGAVGVLVVSGAYASWTTLRGPADLTATPWGSLLLLKLALFSAVGALGAWHWRTAGRRLAGGGGAALRRSLALEVALAAAVILVTGFLAGTAPPE
jgi:copper transport protein